MKRFASLWPVTIACAQYRLAAAVAIVPVQHINTAISDILIMARTALRDIKCRWCFVACRVTTIISCFYFDARVATEGAERGSLPQ